ncbi:MAG TPA: GIY-YIG nuclease family protein [Desulfobulbaceae bacterium]|nr:GIY-YIG nuclease family protein [Desulfobulbaceae bacterium]
MSFFVYILYSSNADRYYCGQTNDLRRRLQQHNDPQYRGSKTTKRFKGPWRLIWSHQCLDRGQAMILEKKIKKRGIKRYLKDQLVESRRRRD